LPHRGQIIGRQRDLGTWTNGPRGDPIAVAGNLRFMNGSRVAEPAELGPVRRDELPGLGVLLLCFSQFLPRRLGGGECLAVPPAIAGSIATRGLGSSSRREPLTAWRAGSASSKAFTIATTGRSGVKPPPFQPWRFQ
jgi:hypothetical protein